MPIAGNRRCILAATSGIPYLTIMASASPLGWPFSTPPAMPLVAAVSADLEMSSPPRRGDVSVAAEAAGTSMESPAMTSNCEPAYTRQSP